MAFLKLYTGKLFEFVLSYSRRQFTRLEPALRKSQSLPCFSTGAVFVFLIACMVLLFPNFTNAQTTITKSITAGSDDAEENGPNGILPAPGFVNLTSPDLELVRDEQTLSSGDQIIGLRFTGMTIPQGATITNAYLIFRAITPDLLNILSGPASLTIKGEAVDNATTFVSSGNNFNISSRSTTSSSAGWVINSWTPGTNVNSPSIVPVVQEIVNRPGWVSGNAIAIIITGTGSRTAASYNGDPVNAPKLVVTYTLAPPLNLSTSVTNVLCHGEATGAIDLTVTGGTPPYTYDWSNDGQEMPDNDMQDLNGLVAGIYMVTVTDAGGTTAATTINITEPAAALNLNFTVANVSLPGGSNGAVDLSVSGGTPNYNYQWSNGAMTQDINNLSEGVYDLTVTDANGCTAFISATVGLNLNLATVNKHLYLNDFLTLDRSNPANPFDNTTALTTTLSTQTPAVVIDATSTSTTLTTSAIIPHTTGTGQNRLMLVGVSLRPRDGENVSSVTYGGTTLTQVGTIANGVNAKIYLYRLLNPSPGTANVVVTFDNAVDKGAVVGVTTFFGVDQTTPLSIFASAIGDSGTPTVSVSSAVGELVFDAVAVRHLNALTPGAGQTERWDLSSGEIRGGGSTEAGAVSTPMTWTSGNNKWAIGAVSIKPAPVMNAVTFTQNPALCSDLIVEADSLISVNVYLDIISGSMPVNPSITALLKYGATNIITLTNPTYDSGSGLLTWTGTLGTDATIPAGEAIALQITTAQAGVNFQIRYDSQVYPSRIALPVSTFIDVDVVGVYNAAHPNGIVITDVPNLGTSYIRVNVTDPFGADDISSVNLSLIKPDLSTVDILLNMAYEVASGGCEKIYQYLWSNPGNLGNWQIHATANEGTEGIKHTASISVNVATPAGPVTQNKQLYLSDPVQALDRIDPVASMDATTAQTAFIGSSVGPVAVDNTSSGSDAASSVTVSHLTGSGANRLMLVGVSYAPADNETISSVTYGGTPLTLVPSGNAANGTNAAMAIYQLINPPAGAADVVVTFNETVQGGAVVGVTTFTGVDQTTPISAATSGTGTSAAPSVSVVSASNELVFAVEANLDNVTATPGAGQSVLWDLFQSTGADAAASIKNGTALTSMSYTLSASKAWAMGAVSIKPISITGISTTSFIQNPVLCDELIIKSGDPISITTYIGDINGNISATPDITAVLKYGSTDIISISTPDYDPMNGTLTWTDNLVGDAIVPAGEALVLTITTAESNLSFKIEYDSETKPSKINLPVSTYVEVTSLAVYDDAYPAGAPVNNAANGSTVYLRADVSDPFGANDITGLDIEILAPGGGVTNVSAGEVAASGCTKTYEYVWNSPAVSGNYDFTATAKEGLENAVIDFEYLDFALCPLTVMAAQTAVPTCFIPNSGEITLSVSGGNGPYSWNWNRSNPAGSDSGVGTIINGLTAGTYEITVTSAGGCTGKTTQVIEEPVGPELDTIVVHASCLGNDGTIDLLVFGGSGDYAYFWSDGGVSEDRAGLMPGNYSVTVWDNLNGCFSVTSAEIVQTDAVGATGMIAHASCFGSSDGFINISPTGGSGGYTFNWDDGPTSEDRTGLAAGIYTVTVFDNGGCQGVLPIEVSEPELLIATATPTSPTCTEVGVIDIEVNGGTALYRFDWADIVGSNNPQNRIGLAAGSYFVTVVDTNGCIASTSATLDPAICDPSAMYVCTSNPADIFSIPPDQTTATYNWTVPLGAVIVSGQGTASVVIDWSGAAAGQDQVCVHTTDIFGGSADSCKTVYIRNVVSNVEISDPTCAGDDVFLSANGGTDYKWSGPAGFASGSEAPVIYNATSGDSGLYTVVVTDEFGCTDTAEVTLTIFDSYSLLFTTTDTDCGLQDGAIDLSVSGGAAPFDFLWSNGETTEDLDNLGADIYTVSVTDNNGCMVSESVSVANIGAHTVSLNVTNLSCFGASDGEISAFGLGGTAPFTYFWSNGSLNQNISGLSSGTYYLTVTGNDGCVASASATIMQPDELLVDRFSKDIDCFGNSNGEIDLIIRGGTALYTFMWSDGFAAEDRTGLLPGVYETTVTDAAGCFSAASITINQPASALSASTTVQDATCFGGANGTVDLTVSGGTLPYTFLWSNGATTEDAGGLIIGNYEVSIIDAEGCTTTALGLVDQPTQIILMHNAQPVSCYDGDNGAINLTVSGGVAGYTFEWSNGASSEDLSNLTAGDYEVTVEDANNCPAILNVSITQPDSLIADALVTDVACNGDASGAIDLTVSGGVPGYTFEWSNGAFSEDLTNLTAGTYSVTATDMNDCVVISEFIVQQPSEISVTGIVTNVDCNGNTTGAMAITASGGFGLLSFDWGGGITIEDRINLAAGIFMLTVTDENFCTKTESFEVTEPPVLVLDIADADVSCNGANDGAIDLSVSGGTPSYNFNWSNGAVSEDISDLSPDNYVVTVIDANNCEAISNATISEPATLTANTTVLNVSCFGAANGGLTANVNGGTPPYAFAWSNGGNTQSIGSIAAGVYSVTITDANNCTVVTEGTVSQPAAELNFSEIITPVSCFDGNDGAIELTVSGGTSAYNFFWQDGNTSEDRSNLLAGIYNLTITDANGCVLPASFEVTEPVLALTIGSTITHVACPGGNTGAIDVEITGGTPPYFYDWDTDGTGDNDDSEDLENLPAGIYQLTVTDSKGCLDTVVIPIITIGTYPVCSISGLDEVVAGTTGNNYDGPAGMSTYSWNISGDGTINGATNGQSVSADAGGSGSFTLSLEVTNGFGCSTSCMKMVVVDDYPIANADANSTNEDTPIVGATVVTNDVPSGDGGNVYNNACVVCTTTANGALTFNSDGTYDYVPNPNYNGTDSFIYELCDVDGDCDTAMVVITIVGQDDAPIANADVNSTNEDTPIVGATVVANDVPSGDGGNVYNNACVVCTTTANGALTFNPDGTYDYVPNPNYNGTDSFIYELCDVDGDCDTAIVVITIVGQDDAPIANADANNTNEDTPIVGATVVINDVPSGDGGNVYNNACVVCTTTANGALSFNPDGTYDYVPNPNYNGTDSFIYELCDVDGDCDTAIVVITILPVNDAPVAFDDPGSTFEDIPLTIDVQSNDSDPENDILTTSIVMQPLHGTAVAVNSDSITYFPAPDFNGQDTFEYVICDAGGLCDTATVVFTVMPVNDAPIANSDVNSTNEDTPIVGATVVTNDVPSGDGDNVYNNACVVCTTTANGALSFNPDGTYDYAPNPDYNGTDSFIYELCDVDGDCDTAIVVITILPVNDAPIAVDDAELTFEDIPFTVDVQSNDSDPENDVLTTSVVMPPPHGTAAVVNSDSITYFPAPDFNGQDTFEYAICDVGGLCDTGMVIFTVLPVNDAPVANADVNSTNEDTPIVGATVVTNDVPSGDGGNVYNNTCVVCTTTSNGTLTFNPDGTYDYVPNPNYNGTDSFIYELCDVDGDCDTAIVVITILPVNDAPIAVDDAELTFEDIPFTVDVQSNDSDSENDILTTSIVMQPLHGTVVVVNSDSITYFSALDFNGQDTFEYAICDAGGLCDTATVVFTVMPVNDAPIANADVNSTNEDTPIVGATVVGNDIPSGDGGNVYNNACVVCMTTANGALTFNPDGTYDYVPNPNYNGTDSFIYELCDVDGDCDTAIVVITIVGQDDAPVANSDINSTNEDTPIVGATVVTNDIPSGDGGNVYNNACVVCTTTANGALTFNSDGTYDYVPNPNYNGTDSFIYELCDVDGDCDTAIVIITIIGQDDAPIANSDVNSTNEDTPIVGATVVANDVPSGDGGNVYNNACVVCTTTSNGALTFNPDGTYDYVPNPNYNGTDSFIYELCDVDGDCDTAIVVITIVGQDDAPIANADVTSTNEDTPIVGATVVTNDVPSGDGGNVYNNACVVCTTTSNGALTFNPDGTYDYVPNPDYNGTDSFIYELCDVDGDCDTAIVIITIIGQDDAPIANADANSTNEDTPIAGATVVTNDVPSGDGGNVYNNACVVCTTTSNGALTFNPDGTYDYVPDADYNGTDSFIYELCDVDGDCDTAIVIITIIGQDDAPIANADANSTNEDTPIVGATVVTNDVPSGDGGNVYNNACVVCTTTSNGALTFNPDGTYDYVPDANYNGTDSFIYELCDVDGDCDTAIVIITIVGQDDAPIANADVNSTDEDTPIVGATVVGNDVPSGDGGNVYNNTCVVCTTTANGALTFNPDGTYDYAPNPNYNGTDSFIYELCDVDGDCDTAIVVITIVGQDDMPIANADNNSTNEDTPIVGATVVTNDVPSGDGGNVYNNACVVCTTTSNGALSFNPDGTYDYVPDADYNGTDSFIYELCDVDGDCDTAIVVITIVGQDDAPITNADVNGTNEDTAIVGATVVGNDVPSGDGGNVYNNACVVCTTTSSGVLTFHPDGTYDYVPDADYNGTDSFIYELCDVDGDCDTAIVVIAILSDNDPPIAVSDRDTTDVDEAVVICVLNNDRDIEGMLDTSSVSLLYGGGHGMSQVDVSGGCIIYTPDGGFEGLDTLRYRVCDQGIPVLCDTAEVYIVVEDVYFDLSLDKHLSSGQASLVDLGADVRYTIVVRNEGLQSAYNIVISDYLPVGMELSPLDSLWQLAGSGEVRYTFSGPLLAGSSDSVEIIVRLSYGYSGESKQNVAEVLMVEDSEGEVYEDIDSEPDNGMPDEDDYDTAEVGLLPHDPTGYIYCDKTGKLVEGGTISVSGPGVVYMIADGSAGYYEWYTDGTPGLYTMSYNHPSGYPLSVKCVAQAGAIDPTGLGDPVNLGSDTLGMYLADTSCASNPYYLAFMLEPGDPYIHRNNLAVQCVLIGSVACADLNGNHVSDIGEPGLDGVLVELYDCLDSLTVLDSVRTVMGGQYRFDGLAGGNYRLRFGLPSGFQYALANAGMDDNRDSDADANGYTHCFMLNPGDCDTTVSACFIPLSGIDGYVWADLDFDGLQDSTETGIDGVDVYLYDALTDTVVSVVQSSGGGLFGFNRVMPGSYYLLFDHSTAPGGYVATLSDANANGSDPIDSDASVQTGRTAVLVLLPGMRASELGAGYYPAPEGLISGLAWKDCNKNGLREVGEGGLPLTPVQLSGQEANGSSVNVSVQTDSAGAYRFENILPGTYRLVFGYPLTPSGISLTLRDVGTDDDIDSDADAVSGETAQWFINGDSLLNVDAGYQDITAPVIVPTAPELAGVNAGDTLTVSCEDILIMRANDVLVTDNCDPSPQYQFTELILGRGNCARDGYLMLMHCGWIATDACGNESRWRVYVRVIDTLAPVLTGIPSDTLVDCNNIPVAATVSAVDNCLNSAVTVSMTQTQSTGACPYTLTRVWTATDECGNASTASQVITVRDDEAPLFLVFPSDTSVSCGSLPVFDTNALHAADNCDLVLSYSYGDTLITPGCPYVLQRTFYATDDCGNVGSARQFITVWDTIAPVFMNVGADTTLQCGGLLPVIDAPTATDDCDTSVVVTQAVEQIAGDCPGALTYVYTWTARDMCGNESQATRRVVLRDTIAPVVLFSLPSELTVECGEPIPDIAPDFRDNCSDSLQISAISGITADSCGYIIDRSWTATDECGNSTTVTQRIYQTDTQSPQVLSVPSDTVLGCRDSLPSGMAVFSDACDSLLTISVSQDTVLTDSCTYEIIRVWTAADDCGNEVSAQQVVRFEDREAPFFFALDPRLSGIMDGDTLTVSCDAIPRFDESSMKAFDDCDGRPALTFEDYALALGDCANDGFTLLMYCGYRAVDRCGNEALLRFYVKVVDNVAPSVSGIPADVTANCGDTVSLSAPVFTDICDPLLTVTLSQDTVFAGNCRYEINRVWTATDDCGNSTTARQIVRISDTEPPVFVQTPGDTTLDCSVQMLPDTLGAVLAMDNCDNELTYTYRDTVLSAACPRIILRRIVATDDCGNSAEASQTIRLTDTIAPVVLFSLPSELTVECGEPIPDIAPDFRDNCSDSLQISAISGITADSCGYIIDRSWTATDECGNSTTVTQRIYQTDTQSPQVLSVPLDTVLGCRDSLPSGMAVFSDACDSLLTISLSQDTVLTDSCTYEIIRVWTAADDCGNEVSAQQVVRFEDREAPFFFALDPRLSGIMDGDTLTVSCDAIPRFDETSVKAFDDCDGDPDVEYEDYAQDLGDCTSDGYLLLMYCGYRAVDRCGNEALLRFYVKVVDDEAPVLSGIPADVVLPCGSPLPGAGVVQADDNCTANVQIDFEERVEADSCAGSSRIVRLWTATDGCGNSATGMQTIQLVDDEAPVLTGVPSDTAIYLDMGQVVPAAAMVSALDACTGAVPVNYSEDTTAVAGCDYTLQRSWTATDACGNTAVQSQQIMVFGGALSLELSSTPAVCTQSTGSAAVTVFGGTAPYAYVWNTGAMTQTIDSLSAGIYAVTVWDANGCTALDSIEVEQQETVLQISLTLSSESCAGNDGVISAVVGNGTAPYAYLWNTGAMTQTIDSLAAGIYAVTVWDANGCTGTASDSLLRDCACVKPGLEKLTTTAAGCTNDDGTASIEITGDESLYSYHWIPDLGIANVPGNIRSGLPSGNYVVLVRELGNDTCDLKVELTIALDCAGEPCLPVFETDTLVAQAQGGIARICLPTDADLQNYELLVDGVVHTQGYVPCVQDTLVYYSYALLNGGGSSGPYRVDFWDGNGTILQGITVNDMEELSVLMNLADTSANWTNDYGTRSLEGGSASGIYGNLQITHLPSQVTLEMQVNRTDVSSGSALDISGLGEHTLILRSLDSPCADTLTVLLESGQPGPRGFIGTKFEVLSMDCSEQATEYCVEDISWVDMNKYALERNGLPYEGTLGGCNYLNNHSYSYFLLPGGGVSGPYRLESWRVGGSYYSGSFATVQELASLLNSYDAQGNWQLDAAMRVIRSEGNARSDYGRLEIVQESSGIRSYLELNTNSIPSGVSLSLERGMNSFVFTRLSDGERDTLTLGLACVRSEYIYDEIEVGQVDTLCLKTEELLGAMTGVENLCPGQAASASFSVLAGTNCVVCRGMEPGMSNACLVICDEYGVCDTTYVELLVRNSASGNAGVADTLYTQQGEEVTGNVLGNDVINGAIRSLRILRQPAYGQVRVNADMTLSYVPFEAYCDEEQSDSFVYEWCGEAGDCVQAEVLVWVLCDDLRIYTGFSPNGDGINETFRIEGLERYPNHVLRIYNRWGNEVYRSRNYQSDWDGDWRGTGLPDGTYFYLLDTGEGVVRSGYVQLQR